MKRLRRWLFYGLATLSLCLCVALILAWATQPNIRRELMLGRWGFDFAIQSRLAAGKINVQIVHYSNTPIGGSLSGVIWQQFGPSPWSDWPGLMWGRGLCEGMDLSGRLWWVRASDWLIIILLSILPAIAWWGRRARLRRRRIAHGLCPICGYDLRATPDRCPECGIVPPGTRIWN